MPTNLGLEYQRRIDRAYAVLSSVSEELASTPARPGGWLRKEILGHLLDSAANNHVRFVDAATTGSYSGSGYHQEGWVRLHAYASQPWSELLARWLDRNQLLARVVQAIPESALAAPCTISGPGPDYHLETTLGFIVTDYLRHLDHHVSQIV
jgi:hypothetical protein